MVGTSRRERTERSGLAGVHNGRVREPGQPIWRNRGRPIWLRAAKMTLEQSVTYRNSKGETWSSRKDDI